MNECASTHRVAFQAYTTGGGAGLLIIDTGYDRGHPDLPNTPLGNCTHGQFGGCDDGLPKPHGTRATGVITARQDGAGVVGVAPGISVLDTYHWGACDSSNGNCQPSEVASALNWAANTLGARGVINMSLATSTDYGSVSMAVSAAYGADHVLVAAMGNDGVQRTNYPAAYSSVLAVGAVNPGGIFPNPDVDYCFAGYPGPTWGSHIDVVGPWYIGDAVNPGGYIQHYCGGTSMAAASVSGTAALIRSRNFSWPNWKVYSQLTNTAQDVHTTGWDPQTGFGLVRADLATGFVAPDAVATILNNHPRLTWSAVPFATDYLIYSKITPNICPNFQLIATTAATAFTDQSIGVTSFLGYNVPLPAYTAISCQLYARAGTGPLYSQAGPVITYKTSLSNPPC